MPRTPTSYATGRLERGVIGFLDLPLQIYNFTCPNCEGVTVLLVKRIVWGVSIRKICWRSKEPTFIRINVSELFLCGHLKVVLWACLVVYTLSQSYGKAYTTLVLDWLESKVFFFCIDFGSFLPCFWLNFFWHALTFEINPFRLCVMTTILC